MGLAGVVVGGDEDKRFEGEGDCEGPRRWRRRSVASEGVRTGRVDQDVAVEREVVERAGEEAVKVAHDLISGVDMDGDAAEVCSVEVDKLGCSTLVVVVVVGAVSSFPSFSSCMSSVAPATACSRNSPVMSVSFIVLPASLYTCC